MKPKYHIGNNLAATVGAYQCILEAAPDDVQTAGRLGVLHFRLGQIERGRKSMAQAAHFAQPISSPPTVVQLEVTTRCNLKCAMCLRTRMLTEVPTTLPMTKASDWNRDMPSQVSDRVFDQCKSAEEIFLHGIGEPLLYHQLDSLIQQSVSRGLQTSLFSNGMLLDKTRSKELLKLGFHRLTISIDGADAETFESLRGGARFEAVIGNLRFLAALKGELGLSIPLLEFHTTVSGANYRQIPAILELAQKMGIDEVSISSLHPSDEFLRQCSANPERLWRHLTVWRTIAETYSIRLMFIGLGQHLRLLEGISPQKGFCIWPWIGLYVTVDGYVTPCCHLTNGRQDGLGNVLNEPLDQIWNGPRFQALRQAILELNPLTKRCHTCAFFAH